MDYNSLIRQLQEQNPFGGNYSNGKSPSKAYLKSVPIFRSEKICYPRGARESLTEMMRRAYENTRHIPASERYHDRKAA